MSTCRSCFVGLSCLSQLRCRDGRSLVLSYEGGCHGTKWIKVAFGLLFSNLFILHHMSCDEVSMRIEELKCKESSTTTESCKLIPLVCGQESTVRDRQHRCAARARNFRPFCCSNIHILLLFLFRWVKIGKKQKKAAEKRILKIKKLIAKY